MGAGLGDPWIGMAVRAELKVIRVGAEVAEQLLAGRDAMTMVAITHRSFHSSEWRWSPEGRSQFGDQKPSRLITSKVVNKKILSVDLAIVPRRLASRRAELPTTITRNCVCGNSPC